MQRVLLALFMVMNLVVMPMVLWPAPSVRDGIGDWSADDLVFLLELGMTPAGDFVGGKMAEVVEDNTGRLDAEDRAAIADYLLGLPARPAP
jgi:hypothetical protein